MKFMAKTKLFIVLTLIVLVAGMAVFGFLGFNNSVDYSKSYEIHVKLEQNIDADKETMKTTADKFFADKDIKIVASQSEETGIIYKIANEQPAEKVAELQDLINNELNGNKASASINVVDANYNIQPLNVIIAYAVSVLVMFIYMLIMNKLASAIAVACSSILSVLLTVALVALTRIPAAPYVQFMPILAGVLSAVLSVVTVGGYREQLKSVEKYSVSEIASKVAVADKKKYVFALIVTLVAAIAVAAFMTPYMLVLGGQIAIVGIVAITVAYYLTPLLWTAIKKNK
ncbi:MAG: hypothetical protein E7348_06255 [Clostridiales bacterium]|nr:hypothetical protein [Clostridiales bacterium]